MFYFQVTLADDFFKVWFPKNGDKYLNEIMYIQNIFEIIVIYFTDVFKDLGKGMLHWARLLLKPKTKVLGCLAILISYR